MDVHAAAPGAALPLGIAVAAAVAALGLAVGLVATGRRGDGNQPAPSLEDGFADDDLPAFREHPPGSPGAVRAAPRAPALSAPAAVAGGGAAMRSVGALALVALVLIAVVGAVAAVSSGRERPAPSAGGGGSSSGGPASSASGSPAPEPAAMSVPAAPSAGQTGAGALGYTSVPLGADGMTARLTFGGVVLEPHAVGVTVTYPSVSVTAADGGAALAHVRLPTWNCLAAEPPADPTAAGCRASVTEYADLPAPALSVQREGGGMRLTGRFPTYTRPNGTAPVYTGRVYELAVTAAPGRALPDGRTAAEGEFFLGRSRAASVGGPGVDVLQIGR